MSISPPPSPRANPIDAAHAALATALSGQYTIERELGRGGMGIVLLARDERLDRQVALKILPPALADQPEVRERFLREARMAAQLSHPHIVPIHRADEIGGFAFFAMGFVDGETLGDRLRNRGTLPPAEVVRLLREVAWALAYAHARGIVHRDVKPENILVERGSGRAIVTDFGIARSDFNPALTQDGLILGTVHYMSPEQANGETLDGRSDLFALGCIGFLALSGRLPFEAQSPQAALVAHATRTPPSLRSVAPQVPAPLASVIDQCLRRRPEERFATGEALADALEQALDAIQHEVRAATPGVLSRDDANVVWRRAAELQAEAAARLEARMRVATQGHQAALTSSMLPAPKTGPDATSTGDATAAPAPSDAFSLSDVQAAAAEAGISESYVALALAELSTASGAIQRERASSSTVERLAISILGSTQRTLSVSRVYRKPPATILAALGRTLQARPYGLSLRETLGGHPLDGGVLVFEIPKAGFGDTNYKWTWSRQGAFSAEARVTLAAMPGDPQSTEVTMQVDLRRGLGLNLAGYLAGAGMCAFMGGIFGLILGKGGFGLAGAALFGSWATGAALAGLSAMTMLRRVYRWGLRKGSGELNAALTSVDASMQAVNIFGELTSGPGSEG